MLRAGWPRLLAGGFSGGILVLSLLAAGWADHIYLADGKALEGKIVAEDSASLLVDTVGGPVKVARDAVRKIEKSKTDREVYHERADALEKNDVQGNFLLGLWCESRGLAQEARYHLLYAVALDPEHEGARKALGQVKYNGEWVDEAKAKEALGLRLYKGTWMTQEAAAGAEAEDLRQELARSLAREVRRIARRIQDADDYRQRIDAEEELASLRDPLAWPAVVALLYDDDPVLRTAALKAVAKLRIQGIAGSLAKAALFDSVPEVRVRAGKLLAGQYDIKVRQILVTALKSPNPEVRSAAASVLAEVKDPATVSALIDTLYAVNRQTGDEPPPELGIRRQPVGAGRVPPGYQAPLDQPVNSPYSYVINCEALEALRKITGQDFGTSKRRWAEWWAEHEEEFVLWHNARPDNPVKKE